MKTLKGGPECLRAVAVFDEHDWKTLRRLLEDYPDKQVNLFILKAQFICLRVLLYRESINTLKYRRPSRTDHRNQVENTIEKLENILNILSEISRGEILPRWHYTLSELGPLYSTGKGYQLSDDPILAENLKATEIAVEASEKINSLISIFQKTLEDYPDKPGPPGTINEELAEQIAEAYRKYIDVPTATTSDSFPSVLQYLFGVVGIKYDYPERLARKILPKK
jgi:hypothetical protein